MKNTKPKEKTVQDKLKAQDLKHREELEKILDIRKLKSVFSTGALDPIPSWTQIYTEIGKLLATKENKDYLIYKIDSLEEKIKYLLEDKEE